MENTDNINIENTNNINMKKLNLKEYIQKHNKKHQKYITKKIKIMKNINKKIEIKQKEHMKKIKNIL
jgi:hypothetical protein